MTAEKYISSYYSSCSNLKLKVLLKDFKFKYKTYESALDLLAYKYQISYGCQMVEVLSKNKTVCKWQPYVRWNDNSEISLNCAYNDFFTVEDAKITNAKTVLYRLQNIIE